MKRLIIFALGISMCIATGLFAMEKFYAQRTPEAKASRVQARQQARQRIQRQAEQRARSRASRSPEEVRALAGYRETAPIDLRQERLRAYEGLEIPQPRAPRSAAELAALEAGYAGMSQNLVPLETREQKLKAYEQLPERRWLDYIRQKEGGLRTDIANLYERGKARVGSSLGDIGHGLGSARMSDYVRAYNPRGGLAYGTRAEDYERAYAARVPQYGSRAWELEEAYGVPYSERLRSRVSPYWEAVRSRMPSMPESTGSRMFGMPSFETGPSAADQVQTRRIPVRTNPWPSTTQWYSEPGWRYGYSWQYNPALEKWEYRSEQKPRFLPSYPTSSE